MVGKTRLALAPMEKHWWQVATRALPLVAQSVADFFAGYISMLRSLGIEVKIMPVPVELADIMPFAEDRTHASYDPDAAHRCWQILGAAGADTSRRRSQLSGLGDARRLFARMHQRGLVAGNGRESRRRASVLCVLESRAAGLRRRAGAARRHLLSPGDARVDSDVRARPLISRPRARAARFFSEHLRGGGGSRELGPGNPRKAPWLEAATFFANLTGLGSRRSKHSQYPSRRPSTSPPGHVICTP